MPRSYPDVRDLLNTKAMPGTKCCACDGPGWRLVRIAWDYMRGSDDILPACKRHWNMADSNEGRFIAHMLTKDKFVRDKGSR